MTARRSSFHFCTFQPLDVLVKSDNRPGVIGTYRHEGEILPQAFAGALRTALLRANGYDFRTSNGRLSVKDDHERALLVQFGIPGFTDNDQPSVFRFAGPWLHAEHLKESCLYLPIPRIVVRKENGAPLTLQLLDTPLSNLPNGVAMLDAPCPVEPWEERWSLHQVCVYLKSGHIEESSADCIEGVERRWGHGRGKSRVVQEGKLYSRPVVRLKDMSTTTHTYAGLVMVPEVASRVEEFVCRLGGDGRRVRIQLRSAKQVLQEIDELKETVLQTIDEASNANSKPRLIMYLSTPTIFEWGWEPDLCANSGLRILAAAVGRPIVVGGWDLLKQQPKQTRRAVPAGSCYVLEITDSALAKTFVENHHCNDSMSVDYKDSGYGCVFFGIYNEK